MTELLNKLSGYKTYITGTAAILTSLVAYLNHTISLPEFIAAIFAAIQTMNIRHAISKSWNNS